MHAIQDTEQKIRLLKEIIKLDASMYNVYNTLAYEYWYIKRDLDQAEQYFKEYLQHHPNNYQTLSDLVFLYIDYKEWRLALKILKETLSVRPETWKDFDRDPRIEPLREEKPNEYEDALNIGRMHPSE
ncbi:tetratricopeptide repeat protein [Mesobacillus maritimus]|uniref:tetratricopeptide repeat protein n=1 Tax=Mesobacillus maritimus TaxID=1643336 RepID=UPI00203C6C99|nr:tetratricopeptide repeat protein [Mesobacillus maritimus]MCM3586991.1 tetratricopeptide repeat protein [Mesobacillus maritimus]